jgi:hypothetical protein
VEEQSHKEEMQAALRGDFERLHARGHPTETPTREGAASTVTRQARRKAERPLLARLLRRG